MFAMLVSRTDLRMEMR